MTRRPVGRVVSRHTFVALRRPSGRGKSGPVLVLYAAQGVTEGQPEVAFAVSKQCGGAVVRNRIRRRLRSAITELAPELLPGAYLVRTDPEAANSTYQELKQCLNDGVAKATKKSKEETA